MALRSHGRSLALMLACVSLIVSATAASGGPAVATGVLQPVAGVKRQQGLPFNFRLVLSNPDAQSVSASVVFGVRPVGASDGAVVSFDRWAGTVTNGTEAVVTSKVTPAQWFGDLGDFEIVVLSDTVSVAPLRFEVTQSRIAVPRFDDVTTELGLDTNLDSNSFCVGGSYIAGASWADVEGDGDLDLYLPRPLAPAQMFINQGGSFLDEASARGVDNPGRLGVGAVFADYDNDGDPDLYVVNEEANRLYVNDGTGNFTDVAVEAGVASDTPDASAAWGDFDNDGHLDLYVANWGRRCNQPGPKEWTYYPDKLYRNNGDGTFTDIVARLHESGSTMGGGLAATWFDYDRDGDVDLYLGNDAVGPGKEPNFLWRNDGAGPNGWKFTNVSSESKTGIFMHSMGIGVGDYDRDLDLDLAISNIRESVLLNNRSDGTFADKAAKARVDRPFQRLDEKAITWGMEIRDLNNDGWEDLYVAAGEIDQPTYQPNELYTNGRNGRFLDHSAPSGTDDEGISRGIAVADYDHDGLLDMYVVNWKGFPKLYRNATETSDHWLMVDTIGRKSNRDGCGAIAILKAKKPNGKRFRQIRQVFCGSTSVGSGSDPTLHFGLGKAKRIVKLKIEWPSGRKSVKKGFSADRVLTIKEPRA